MEGAERAFAALAHGPLDEAYNDLQYVVQDYVNVHRVVLAWRSWALLDLTGKEHAHTLLRQSVRFCVDEEGRSIGQEPGRARRCGPPAQAARPQRLGEPLLRAIASPDDAWIERMSQTIYASRRDQAAEAVAEALADGVSPEVVGEAISLAANQLVLHDPGRTQGGLAGEAQGQRPWRVGRRARLRCRQRLAEHRPGQRPPQHYASLIVGAYHTAGQAGGLNPQAYPFAEHREKVAAIEPDALLHEAEAAIKANDQARACALVHRYGELGRPARPAFDLLLRYAISEDGALHAEKYYRTVTEEFATTRPAFRWRQLAALARVTASEYGHPAPASNKHASS